MMAMNRILLAISLLWFAVPAQATIYQCVSGGQIAYQDRPCAQGTESWQEIGDSGKPVGERHYANPTPDPLSTSSVTSLPANMAVPIAEQQTVASAASRVASMPEVQVPAASEDNVSAQVRPNIPAPFIAQTSGQSSSLSGIKEIEDAQVAVGNESSTEAGHQQHQQVTVTAGSGAFQLDLSVWENLKKGASLSEVKQYFPETLPGNQALGDDFDHELLRADVVNFNGHRYEAQFFFDQHTDKDTPRFTQLRLSPGNFTNDAENQQIMIDDVTAFRERYGKEATNQTVDGVFGAEKVVKWKLPAAMLTLKLEPFVTGQSTYTIRCTPK